MPYTDFKGRRTKFAPTVGGINLCEAFMPPTAAAVRRGRRTLQVCCNKIVQILLFQLFLAANAFIRPVGAGSVRNEA